MAGQGQASAILAIAEVLTAGQWKVVFRCIPNRAHVGVVPIPVKGSSRQRYPDILATRGGVVRLIEVEPKLDTATAQDIMERFQQQRAALEAPETWSPWRERVRAMTGVTLPSLPTIKCELAYLRAAADGEAAKAMLEALGIRVGAIRDFAA